MASRPIDPDKEVMSDKQKHIIEVDIGWAAFFILFVLIWVFSGIVKEYFDNQKPCPKCGHVVTPDK